MDDGQIKSEGYFLRQGVSSSPSLYTCSAFGGAAAEEVEGADYYFIIVKVIWD